MSLPRLPERAKIVIRAVINCVLIGIGSYGSNLLLILQDGKDPTPIQNKIMLVTAGLLILNDIKSRMTPTQ